MPTAVESQKIQGNVDLFIKITGVKQGVIKGESFDAKHKGEIDVESYTWGVKLAYDLATGAAAGKRQHSVLKFVMRSQSATPLLLQATCTNETLKEVVLTCRKAGGKQEEYMKWKLTNARVCQMNHGYLIPDNIIPHDEVSLTFQKIELNYQAQNQDGTLGSALMFSDDWSLNY
jgi:type VI secretion system secreted protein Hcp